MLQQKKKKNSLENSLKATDEAQAKLPGSYNKSVSQKMHLEGRQAHV